MKHSKIAFTALTVVSAFAMLSACQSATYPEAKVVSSIKEICKKEYRIEDVQIKIKGSTIGVYLPVKKLFAADIKKVIMSGKAADLESLFTPSPEAMERVENVLFATSRVVLSSDKKFDFYSLYATDISTGLQLVLVGNVMDMKRVRFWDISHSEYRKRLLHELKLDRAALWQKPVLGLLRDAGHAETKQVIDNYFGKAFTPEVASQIFYNFILSLKDKQNVRIDIKDIKSHPYEDNQALVFVRLTETYEPKPGISKEKFDYPSGTTLEYIFIVDLIEDGFKIVQVVPFYYVGSGKQLMKIQLPPEFDLYKNLETWNDRFDVEEVNMGEFLAKQLTRRVQEMLMGDERVRGTVKHAEIRFYYRSKPEELEAGRAKPYFEFDFNLRTKAMRRTPSTLEQAAEDEDVRYVLGITIREFTTLIKGYEFTDYDDLELLWDVATGGSSLALEPDRLELFRKKKIGIQALLQNQAQTS